MTVLPAQWDVPANVRAYFSTRSVASEGDAYSGFNLAAHVGDAPLAVETNRRQLLSDCDGLQSVQWLDQVHGTDVHRVSQVYEGAPRADAAVTRLPGVACAVLTADCLPVLFCDDHGAQVAAAHAGWRGLLAGVLINTVQAFAQPPAALRVWFGPCIRQPRFEVGAEVREKFLAEFSGPTSSAIASAFLPSSKPGHYRCDLAALAAMQLRALGVNHISDCGLCSYDDPRFYSYRRENPCGRLVSLIYRLP